MLAIRRAPADHGTQACCLGPMLCNIVVGNVYHGWYIVAIPDPVLFIICMPDTDVNENSHGGYSETAGHKKN